MINRWYEPLVSLLFLLHGGWEAIGGGTDDHTSRRRESRTRVPKNTSIRRCLLYFS